MRQSRALWTKNSRGFILVWLSDFKLNAAWHSMIPKELITAGIEWIPLFLSLFCLVGIHVRLQSRKSDAFSSPEEELKKCNYGFICSQWKLEFKVHTFSWFCSCPSWTKLKHYSMYIKGRLWSKIVSTLLKKTCQNNPSITQAGHIQVLITWLLHRCVFGW